MFLITRPSGANKQNHGLTQMTRIQIEDEKHFTTATGIRVILYIRDPYISLIHYTDNIHYF